MGDSEKDRFGDKLRDKERAQEDEYFARRDRELLEKLRAQRRQGAGRPCGGTMRCPRCGTPLGERVQQHVTVDECAQCGGLWLDRGELDQIARREQDGWLAQLLRSRLAGA